MSDSLGGGSRPPPKPHLDGSAGLLPASGAGRPSSGEPKGCSWRSGKANLVGSSSACEEMPLHGTLGDLMEEGEATPIAGNASCGSAEQLVRDLGGDGLRPPPYLLLKDSVGMVPASDDWRAFFGVVDPVSGGMEIGSQASGIIPIGGVDVCMVEGDKSSLPNSASPDFGTHKASGIIPIGGSNMQGTGKTNCGVLNEFCAQKMSNNSQELNGDVSAKIPMEGGNMQATDYLYSASLLQSMPGVCPYAPSICEQQKPNSGISSASHSPWRSPTNAWNRPRVVPMPPKKELGQLSLDGTTALLDDGEIDAALVRLNGALVGRMFGRKIPYPQLSSELKRRWECFGVFRLVTLSSDCFICLFNCAAARDTVLVEGPWVLFGQVLGLDRWSPTFSPSSSDGFLTSVWVRMPKLPFFCWTATNIARIVALIGEPLWIDSATDRLERGLFARACVRLDLSKPLKAGLWIEGKLRKFFQPLVYEGLSSFCFRCSQVGHKASSCKLPVTKKTEVPCPKVPLTKMVSARPTSLDAGREGLQGDGISGQVLGHVEVNSDGKDVPVLDHVEVVPDNNVVPQTLEGRGAGPWMLVARKKMPNKGKSIANLNAQVNASGRVGIKNSATYGGKQDISAIKSSQKPLYVKNFEKQNHVRFKLMLNDLGLPKSSGMLNMDGGQPIFGGFTALPTAGKINLDAPHDVVWLDDVGTAVPHTTKHSPCSQEPVVGPCAISDITMCMDGSNSTELGLDSSSSPLSALVPYVNLDTSDMMRSGIKSLKKERMLNDLGPVSLTPRKRRMIVVNHDGGVASSSLPP